MAKKKRDKYWDEVIDCAISYATREDFLPTKLQGVFDRYFRVYSLLKFESAEWENIPHRNAMAKDIINELSSKVAKGILKENELSFVSEKLYDIARYPEYR